VSIGLAAGRRSDIGPVGLSLRTQPSSAMEPDMESQTTDISTAGRRAGWVLSGIVICPSSGFLGQQAA